MSRRIVRVLAIIAAVLLLAIGGLIVWTWIVPPWQCLSNSSTMTTFCWREYWGPFGWRGADIEQRPYDPQFPDIQTPPAWME